MQFARLLLSVKQLVKCLEVLENLFSFEPTTHSSGGEIIMLRRWGLLLSTAPKLASI